MSFEHEITLCVLRLHGVCSCMHLQLTPGHSSRQKWRLCAETEVMNLHCDEEVLLDENAAARAHTFYMVGGMEVSPDQTLLAWAEDTMGGEKFSLRVKSLASGKQLLAQPIEVVALVKAKLL